MSNENSIKEKSKEEILSNHSPHGEYNSYYHEHAILEMMEEYAEIREKKLLEYLIGELFLLHNPEEVYELYIKDLKQQQP